MSRSTTPTRFLDQIVTVIRDLVFGIEDSLVSTLGVITGVAGGTQDRYTVLLAGVVVIIVEALSMAAGTYLSAKSEREVQERRLTEERETIAERPSEEQAKLGDLYRQRGFTEEEVRILLKRTAQSRSLLLEELAVHRLGIPISAKRLPATRNALTMGISYLLAGLVPIAPYLFLPVLSAIPISVTLTVLTLFAVGFAEGAIAGRRRLRSGLEMAAVSTAAAGLGFVIGRVAAKLFGV